MNTRILVVEEIDKTISKSHLHEFDTRIQRIVKSEQEQEVLLNRQKLTQLKLFAKITF